MSSQFSASSTPTSGTIESLKRLEATPQGRRDRWADEINFAEKELKKFHESARRVNKRFIDDRDAVETNQKWINLFSTNVGILEASLYAQIPGVDVSRRFADMNDDVARVGSIILQRCIEQDMAEPSCDFDQVMRQAVSDRLIPGLGTAWLRLETETEDQPEITDENGGVTVPTDEEGNPLQRITHQEARIDYVYWEDFLWSPCRVWAERRWIARRVPMDRDKLIARFGEDMGKRIPLDYEPSKGIVSDVSTPRNVLLKRACIYEIWDREKREVIWLSKGVTELLDVKPDPLGLDNFEPCPRPMFANLTTSSCVPKPDYALIQDQYVEMDETNNRISLLIIACKVVGVYDRSAEGIQRMLTEGYDNTLIPVDNWAMFAEKGGVKGQIDWLPLDTVVQALGQLQAHREAIKAQIYELTGISDIVRGASKASETLGAQELKSKYASIRIQKLQDEVTRFAQEILQIKAEILVKHFDPMILAKMANVENMVPEDQPLAIPALQLLKGNPEEMEWRVHIQADALAMIDYTAQKNERSEFMNSVATFLQSASTVGQGAPQLIPLMLELLKFGVAGFRVSKDVEGIFDRYIKEFNAELEAKKNAPPPPDPEQQKMQAQMQMEQQKFQLEQQKMQMEMQMAQQQAAFDMEMAQRKQASDAMADQQKLAYDRETAQIKLEYERQANEMKLRQMELEMQIKARGQMLDMELQEQQRNQGMEAASAMHQEKMTMTRQMHDEKIAAMKAPKTATTSTGKKVSVSSE